MASDATKGPWFVSRKLEVGPRSDADDQSNGMIIPIADVYGPNAKADAEFIAAAPSRIAALEAENAKMREALTEIAGPRDLPHGINAMIAVRRIAKDVLAKIYRRDDGQQ